MKNTASISIIATSILLSGCGSTDLDLVAYDGKDHESTIHIADGKGVLTWAVPGEKEPTVIQIESVNATFPEFVGKIISRNHYDMRITGYGSVLSLNRDAGGYTCYDCTTIHKNLTQATPPVLWARVKS